MDTDRYWNPILETLPRDRLEKLQLRRFREAMAWAMDHSPLYARMYREAGVHPEHIVTLDDVRRVPLVSKEDLRLAQQDKQPFPYGDVLGVPPDEVSVMHQTAGTTGKPLYVPDTYESWQELAEMWCYILYGMGFRRRDRIFMPFGYGIYIAYWMGHYAAEKLGCEVVPGGSMDARARISKIAEIRATGLMNTPTYGLRLAEVAREMGIDPVRDLPVRKMLCAGEPMPEPTRVELERQWGADVYDHIGAAEAGAWAAMCTEKHGLHVLEPFYLLEVLDLETLSQPVAPGEKGIAVITAFGRRSIPCIRYNLKDVVTLSQRDCPCGRTSRLIETPRGRADHLTKISGALFNPVAVEETIRGGFPEIAEFETVADRPANQDELLVKIEVKSPPGQSSDGTARRLAEGLKLKTGLTFRVEVVPAQTLPRYELKAARFKDIRRHA